MTGGLTGELAELPEGSRREWRPGIPSVEDLVAHEAAGGLWLVLDPAFPDRPTVARLKHTAWEEADGTRHPPAPCIQNGRTFFQPLGRTHWGTRSYYAPVDWEAMPAAWATDAG